MVPTTLSLSYKALRNAQRTCQTSESVNKVDPDWGEPGTSVTAFAEVVYMSVCGHIP